MKAKIKQYEILLMLALAACLGAGVGTFSKIGLRSFSPVSFTLIRFLLAGAVLIPIVLFREKNINLKNLKMLVLVSLLATANVTLFIFGVGHTTATISQTLYAAVPLFSAIITFIFMKERLGSKKELGLLVGFLGVLVIILLPTLGKASPNNGTLLGNLLIFSAVLCVSFYFFFSKKLQNNHTPIFLTTANVILTILVQSALLPVMANASSATNFSQVTALGWFSVIYAGVVGTAVYYVLYQYAIKKASPTIAALSFYMQPVFGLMWAAILLGERITGGFVVGASLALVGVYIVTNSKQENL